MKKYLSAFWNRGKNVEHCPWSIVDVIVLTVLMAVFLFNDPFFVGMRIVTFLRTHFAIFTREPKLLYYLNIYINSLIFKSLSIIFLVAIVHARKIPFRKTVVFHGKMPDLRDWWMPVFIGVCILFRVLASPNPLVPNMPFNSVFLNAKIIGNIVIISSVIFVAPFTEEIVFRGFLYPALNRYMGISPAIIITSFLFTLAHYPQMSDEWGFLSMIFVLSLLITYARAKTGSTFLAIIMHFIYNTVSICVGLVDYIILRY